MASRKGQTHRPWSAEDDALYLAHYQTTHYEKLATMLGRSVDATRNRRHTLKLPYSSNATQNAAWTDEQIIALRSTYERAGAIGLTAFAKSIGKLKSNVCRKAKELGLRRDRKRRRVDVRKVDLQVRMTKAEVAAAASARTKRLFAERGHPRGMLGKKHTPELKAAQSERSRAMWADPHSKINSEEASQKRSDSLLARNRSGAMNNGYSRCRGGRRDDLGNIYFRSSWEANYARYLNFMQQRGEVLWWNYEAHTFEFRRIKRGTRSYLPDFLVVRPGGRYEWHEVKGWMDRKSQTKLTRMAIYFPGETVVVIGKQWFAQATRGGLAGAIPHWEHAKSSRQKRAA